MSYCDMKPCVVCGDHKEFCKCKRCPACNERGCIKHSSEFVLEAMAEDLAFRLATVKIELLIRRKNGTALRDAG